MDVYSVSRKLRHAAIYIMVAARITLSPTSAWALLATDISTIVPLANSKELDFGTKPDTVKDAGADKVDKDSAEQEDGLDLTTWLLAGGVVAGTLLAGAITEEIHGKSEKKKVPLPVPPETGKKPKAFMSKEYRRNYGLGVINAASRYADGGTGKGAVLALFDTGTDISHADMSSNIIDRWSYFTDSRDVTDYDGHGTHVASTIAGARNDLGTHGVAFEAKLAVFQGVSWTGGPERSINLLDAFVDAQYRSIELGASAINHSWGLGSGKREVLISEFDQNKLTRWFGNDVLPALHDSARAGLVTVFATGNSFQDEVGVLAGIPVHFPDLADHMLAVGAVDRSGHIADFSNRCGQAAQFCIVAPGVDIYAAASTSAGFAKDSFRYSSGTSMAAAHVTGAIGVLASNFPELTGAEITRILRDTATDLGSKGIDRIYGNGLLNLENAVAPQGELRVISGDSIDSGWFNLDDSLIVADTAILSSLTASLADRNFLVTDRYARGYNLALHEMIVARTDSIASARSGLARFTAALEPQSHLPTSDFLVSASDLDPRNEAIWADARAFGSPYIGLIDAAHLIMLKHIGPGWLAAKNALDSKTGTYAAAEYSTISARGHRVAFEVGHLTEENTLLGTRIGGAFGDDLQARTRFARFHSDLKLNNGLTLAFSASTGNTSFASKGILAQGRSISSSAFGVGIRKAGVLSRDDSLSLGYSRPLSINRGRLVIDAPVALAVAENGVRSRTVYRNRQEIGMAASDIITELQMGYSIPAFGGRVSLGAVWRPENKVQDGYALGFGYSASF